MYQSYQYIKSFFTFTGRDIPKPDYDSDDDKSIELNYGKSMPELQEAEETEAGPEASDGRRRREERGAADGEGIQCVLIHTPFCLC